MAPLALPQDFKDLLKLFLEKKVSFLIVGGYAVAFHGHPRFTGDIDIWVERTQDNAEKIVSSLREFGFDTPNLRSDMFMAEDFITHMGVEPMRIEIFTHIPGLVFKNTSSVTQKIENCGAVPFISLEDLKIAKKASGRLQDLADLEKLP